MIMDTIFRQVSMLAAGVVFLHACRKFFAIRMGVKAIPIKLMGQQNQAGISFIPILDMPVIRLLGKPVAVAAVLREVPYTIM